jgi:cell division septation protein DedD
MNSLDRVVVWLVYAYIIALGAVYLIAPPPPKPSQPWQLPAWIISGRPAPSTARTTPPLVVAPPIHARPGPPDTSARALAPGGSTNSTPAAQVPAHIPATEQMSVLSPPSAPSPRVPTSGAQPSRYTVQVGALRYRENVDKLVQQLEANGFMPNVTHAGLYRVRVGQDLERNAANHLAADLQAAGFDTYVTRQ